MELKASKCPESSDREIKLETFRDNRAYFFILDFATEPFGYKIAPSGDFDYSMDLPENYAGSRTGGCQWDL